MNVEKKLQEIKKKREKSQEHQTVQRRPLNPIMVVLLSVFTGGLFMVYWLYVTSRTLQEAPDRRLLLGFFIPGINIFVAIYYLWQMSRSLSKEMNYEPKQIMMLWIIPPAALYFIQSQLNKSAMPKADKKTHRKTHKSHKKFRKKHHKKSHKKSTYEQRKYFAGMIDKAGFDVSFNQIFKYIGMVTLGLLGIATIYLIIRFVIEGTFLWDAITLLATVWVTGFILIFLVLWLGFFIYTDLLIMKRKKEVEEVFPDFLQLTAANINAGMPIDRALWFAVRPRFGILAKEMETVAKATMVGESLETALMDFSRKYDSVTIKRALNLVLEGLASGGEIGDILTRVANNIRETEIMKKEMAANVMTYVIFILFATLGAAPFLFGLTTQLIVIMQSIMGDISVGSGSESFGGLGSMLGGGESIALADYQMFAIVSILVTCFFSSVLISVITKGNAKEAFRKMPLYMLIGIANYFIAFTLMNMLLGGFFA